MRVGEPGPLGRDQEVTRKGELKTAGDGDPVNRPDQRFGYLRQNWPGRGRGQRAAGLAELGQIKAGAKGGSAPVSTIARTEASDSSPASVVRRLVSSAPDSALTPGRAGSASQPRPGLESRTAHPSRRSPPQLTLSQRARRKTWQRERLQLRPALTDNQPVDLAAKLQIKPGTQVAVIGRPADWTRPRPARSVGQRSGCGRAPSSRSPGSVMT